MDVFKPRAAEIDALLVLAGETFVEGDPAVVRGEAFSNVARAAYCYLFECAEQGVRPSREADRLISLCLDVVTACLPPSEEKK